MTQPMSRRGWPTKVSQHAHDAACNQAGVGGANTVPFGSLWLLFTLSKPSKKVHCQVHYACYLYTTRQPADFKEVNRDYSLQHFFAMQTTMV